MRFADKVVHLMNMVFAVVLNERGLVVAQRSIEANKGPIYDQLDSGKELVSKFGHYVYKIAVEVDDKTGDIKYKEICAVKAWLDSTQRLQYDRKVFNPAPYSMTGKCALPSQLNTWTGFVHKQTRTYNNEELAELENGQLKAFSGYLKDIVANGNDKVYRWLLNWISWTLKFPHVKLPTVPILRSDDEGTGKTTVGDLLKYLMGEKYYVKPSTVDELQRNFNEHLFATTKLMVLDEAHKGNSKSSAGAFRNIVTQEEQLLERKHRDPRMQAVYYNIIMMSNDKKIVQIPGSNRRFVVLEVNPKFGGPHATAAEEYFGPVYATNRQVLFDYLCSLPNDDWNYRAIPVTAATRDQVISSFDPIDSYLYSMLHDIQRYISSYDPDVGGFVAKDVIFNSFSMFVSEETSGVSRSYHSASTVSFWKRFHSTFQCGPELRPVMNGSRSRGFKLHDLGTLRQQFCRKHKMANFFTDTEES